MGSFVKPNAAKFFFLFFNMTLCQDMLKNELREEHNPQSCLKLSKGNLNKEELKSEIWLTSSLYSQLLFSCFLAFREVQKRE